MRTISLVAGARPNFMKIAPIIRALNHYKDKLSWTLVHTGQHYDREMSDVFFEELGIPSPDYHLDAGGGSHAEQTAKIMIGYERVCMERRPDLVLVVGDVNSTLACSIVAKKLNIQLAHVEAGLRSGDISMPEEVNRRVTDALSDVFFVTEESGVANLLREGHPERSIHFVGHVMIDNLYYQLEKLNKAEWESSVSKSLRQGLDSYGVVTLHRASNVDSPAVFGPIVGALKEISCRLPLIFPVHPRTANRLKTQGIVIPDSIKLCPPLPYMEFLDLWSNAAIVLTDSGGVQEESSALGVPCLTLRQNTERPVTVTQGSNVVVGCNPETIIKEFEKVEANNFRRSNSRPPFWDGHAAERICEILLKVMGTENA